MSIENLVADYGPTVLAGVVTVAGIIFGLIFKKQSMLRTALFAFGRAVATAAREVSQTYTDEIKKAREATSPGGAELTPEEKANARAMAIAKAKTYIGKKGLDLIMGELGIAKADEDAYVGGAIEAEVNAMKLAAKAVQNGVAKPTVTAAPVPR